MITVKALKKLAKSRNFIFTVIVYPLGIFAYLYFRKYINMNPFKEQNIKWYSGLSFLVMAFLAIYTVYELIEKRLLHKIQGDKLKIKQSEGTWRK